MFINEREMKVEMTAEEYKNAMTPGTEEYNVYREIRRDYPGFRAEVIKCKKARNEFSALKMKDIKTYVEKHGTDEQKEHFTFISKKSVTVDGEYVEAQSFFKIKEWFLNEFEFKKARKEYREKVERICETAANKAATLA